MLQISFSVIWLRKLGKGMKSERWIDSLSVKSESPFFGVDCMKAKFEDERKSGQTETKESGQVGSQH